MYHGEVAGIHLLLPHCAAAAAASNFFTDAPDFIVGPCNPNSFPHDFSHNSTSDEAEEDLHHLSAAAAEERRRRRLISNRESARRSRMRKQRHIDELLAQVLRLRSENHGLIDRLNRVAEHHDRVTEENVRLKEEAACLRRALGDLPMRSPYSVAEDFEKQEGEEEEEEELVASLFYL